MKQARNTGHTIPEAVKGHTSNTSLSIPVFHVLLQHSFNPPLCFMCFSSTALIPPTCFMCFSSTALILLTCSMCFSSTALIQTCDSITQFTALPICKYLWVEYYIKTSPTGLRIKKKKSPSDSNHHHQSQRLPPFPDTLPPQRQSLTTHHLYSTPLD